MVTQYWGNEEGMRRYRESFDEPWCSPVTRNATPELARQIFSLGHLRSSCVCCLRAQKISSPVGLLGNEVADRHVSADLSPSTPIIDVRHRSG